MIKMFLAAKIIPEKIKELKQTMESIKKDLESLQCRMDFILARQVPQPSNVSIIFEWDNEQDFECSMDKNEFKVVFGAVKVLCKDLSYFCNSLSEKWKGLLKNLYLPETQRSLTLPDERDMPYHTVSGLEHSN